MNAHNTVEHAEPEKMVVQKYREEKIFFGGAMTGKKTLTVVISLFALGCQQMYAGTSPPVDQESRASDGKSADTRIQSRKDVYAKANLTGDRRSDGATFAQGIYENRRFGRIVTRMVGDGLEVRMGVARTPVEVLDTTANRLLVDLTNRGTPIEFIFPSTNGTAWAVRWNEETFERLKETGVSQTRNSAVNDKLIRKSRLVDSNIDSVWWKWTTHEGLKTFFGVGNKMDLAIGAPYEIYFLPQNPPGLRGGEGNTVLAYLPKRMLSFTWNAPPQFPEERNSVQRTWVVVLFEPVGEGKTRVTINHVGWMSGGKWDEVYAYFDKAWVTVLDWFERASLR